MRKINVLLLCLSIVLFIAGTNINIQAQNNPQSGRITGKIVDSISKAPIQFAMVLLLNPADSVIKTGVSTNEKGEFVFEGVGEKLLLKVRMMGYKDIITPITSQANNLTTLGEIVLSPTVKELNTVTILARRPIIVPVSGGYRVEIEKNPIVDKNQSALEVLRAVPGVVVKGTQVEVVGKNGLLIQVNGLDKKLDASQIESYLTFISGDNIKQIEVIRNPSAAFSSSVGSVINIITKHSLKEGYFGTIKGNIGTHSKYGGGLDFSIVKSKFNFSLSMNESYRQSFSNSEFRFRYRDNLSSSDEYTQLSDIPRSLVNMQTVNSESSYKINENHTIGGSIYYLGYTSSSDFSNIVSSIAPSPVIPNSSMVQDQDNFFGKGSIDLYSKSKLTNNRKLVFQLNYAFMDIDDRDNDYQIFNSNNLPQSLNYEQKNWSYERAYTIKSIYSASLWKNVNSDMGTELIYSTLNSHFSDNPLPYSDIQNQEVANYFRYHESVVAAFINFNITQKKWNGTIGLRDEKMFANSLSQEINKTDFTKDYINNYFLPTVTLSYNISGNQMLALGLKQNITRPMYKSYNPFKYLYQPTILVKGNPDLKPSINSTADITYTFQPSAKHTYMMIGGISYAEKMIMPGFEIDPETSKFIFFQQNLSDLQNVYLYFSSQNTLSKRLSIQTSLSVSSNSYKRIKNSLAGQNENHPGISFTLDGSYKLPCEVNSTIHYEYNTASITAQGKDGSSNYMSITLSRSFSKDKFSAYLNLVNPFHRMKSSNEFNTSFVLGKITTYSEASVFRLGASYKFGKAKRTTIQKQNAIMNTRM